MSLNLLDILKNQVSDSLVKGASNFLGENESSTRSAVNAILPTILGSFTQKASTEAGAGSLFNMIKDGGFDGSMLNNLSGLLGGGDQTNGLVNSGTSILKSLLGDKLGSIVDWVASFSGIRQSSASSLMGLATPVLMSVLGKQVKDRGLSASGLMSLLGDQSSFIKAAAPAGLSSLLGFSSLGDNVAAAANTAAHNVRTATAQTVETTREVVEEGGNLFGRLLPWLGLLLLGGLIFYFMRGCGNKPAEVVDTTAAVIDSTANKVGNMADSASTAVSRFFTKTLSTGYALRGAAETGIESQLVNFIEDTNAKVNDTTWFNFDRLLFETGKASLMPESQEQVNNMAEILKAFPSVHIKIGGYTDNVGNAANNQKLSQERANRVMQALINLGIARPRLQAEGYGDKHPVASNDTEEGRQQNRRIAVRVTKK